MTSRLLGRLVVDPFAHDLLLGAHLRDELIDAAREVANRLVAAGAAAGTRGTPAPPRMRAESSSTARCIS